MKYLSFLFALILLSSCFSKPAPLEVQTCTDSCFVITGRLTDGHDPLPWVPLRFRYEEYNLFFGMYANVGYTTTNEDGTFQINFSAKQYKDAYGRYDISGRKEGYFFPLEEGDTVLGSVRLRQSDVNRPAYVPLVMYKAAYLRIKVKDSTAIKSDLRYTINGQFYEVKLKRLDSISSIHKVVAGKPTIIAWNRTDSGKTVRVYDTIVLNHNEERVYELKQ